MARGPGMEESDAKAPQLSKSEVLAKLMQSMRCDAETAQQLLVDFWQNPEKEEQPAESRKGRIEQFQLSADRQWVQWQRAKTARAPVTDDLVVRYTSFADDDARAAKKREAAMLFSTAESQLNSEVDWEQGLKAAMESWVMHKELADSAGEADSARLVVHAHRLKADMAHWDPTLGDNVAHEALREAGNIVARELARFRAKGDARGEAAMLLSQAELTLEDRGSAKVNRAEQSQSLASQASRIFSQVGDQPMQARALLATASARSAGHKYALASEAAKEAVELYSQMDDRVGESIALHTAASAMGLAHELESAVQHAEESLELARDLGNRKLHAFKTTILLASLQLERDRPHQALAYAKEAIDLLQELELGKGWLSAAEAIMVEAHIAKDEEGRAVEVALQGLERCQQSRDKREEVFAQSTLARAHLANEETSQAMAAAQAAVDACREVGDRSWEAIALLTVAQAHLARNNAEAAQKAVQTAVETFQTDEDVHHEAVCTILLSDIHVMRGEVDTALEAAERGRGLFRDGDETDQEEVALLALSQAHGIKGDIARAMVFAEELLTLAKETGHRRGEALAHRLFSEWHMAKGDFHNGLDSAKAMRKVFQELRNFRSEAQALQQIAAVHLAAGEPLFAARAAETAQKICLRERHQKDLVFTLVLATEAYLKLLEEPPRTPMRGSTDAAFKAVKAAEEAVALAHRVARTPLEASARLIRARVMFATGDADQAAKGAQRARELCYHMGDRWGEGRCWLLLAQANYYLDHGFSVAKDSIRQSLKLFRELRDRQAEAAVLDAMSVMGFEETPDEMEPAHAEPQVPPDAAEAASEPLGATSTVEKRGLDREYVQSVVIRMAEQAIGLDDALVLDSPLLDMGMDSLTAVSFRNGLQDSLAMRLPSSLVFDYPSIHALTRQLMHFSHSR